MTVVVALLLPLFLIASGCGRKTETAAPPPQTAQTGRQEPAAVSPETAGSIVGTVLFEGTPPAREPIRMEGNPECKAIHPGTALSEDVMVDDGRVQNVFVYVKEGLEGRAFPPPSEPVTIDQAGCVFTPHVVGVQVGQPLLLVNSDPTLHNVHAFPKNSVAWNLGFPSQGMKRTKTLPKPEVMIPVKCDVHPWMRAYIGVLPHPYFAVTAPDGTFELKGLPPGTYGIEAWHEKFGAQTQTVTVGEREEKEMSFIYRIKD